jgi:hypothetical protein
MSDKILAVLMNWRRPGNIEQIITAYRRQSTPIGCIALVDCAIEEQYRVPESVRKLADVCFTVDFNIGPCCRFIPPTILTGFPYTFFGVDDHVPGRRHVEHLLHCMKSLGPGCGTVGSDGRIVQDGAILRRKASVVRRHLGIPADEPLPVDVITSSELTRTSYVTKAIEYRNWLARTYPGMPLFEDDLILCLGVSWATTGANCYVAPESDDPETSWRAVRLPAPHALCARPDHDKVRNEFIQRAIAHGWQPVVNRMVTHPVAVPAGAIEDG